MNGEDEIIILMSVLVIGTWIRLRPDRGTYPDWRAKAGLSALICSSTSAGIDLILRGLKHFSSVNAPEVYFRALEAMTLLALLGVLLGLFGKGRPRLAGLGLSSVMLAIAFFTFATSGH
jgi:hypothetical protein